MHDHEELKRCIAAARSGRREAFDALVAALRATPRVPAAVLLELLASSEAILRRAAVAACGGRDELELMRALEELANDADADVRRALAQALRGIRGLDA